MFGVVKILLLKVIRLRRVTVFRRQDVGGICSVLEGCCVRRSGCRNMPMWMERKRDSIGNGWFALLLLVGWMGRDIMDVEGKLGKLRNSSFFIDGCE